MCRLTAYLGAPAPVSTLVFGGTHPLREQAWAPRELLTGSVNADGWGVTWYRGEKPVRLARAEPIWHARSLATTLEGVAASTALAAVRNATEGLPVAEDAVGPLTFGRWSFVLNGFVPSFRARHMRALRRRLPDALYGALLGVSDAETLFLLAVSAVEEGASPADALERTAEVALRQVGPDGEECQLTMLLAEADRVAVLRTSNRERLNSLYRLDRGGLAPEGVLLASEPLDGDPGWTPVAAREPVELRRDPPPRTRDRGPDA